MDGSIEMSADQRKVLLAAIGRTCAPPVGRTLCSSWQRDGVQRVTRTRSSSGPRPVDLVPLRRYGARLRQYVLCDGIRRDTLRRMIKTAYLLVLSFLLLELAVQAQEPPLKEASADQAAESQETAAKEVQKFGFTFAHGDKAKLKLRETPVLRYTNPLRGDVHSALYIWTHEGRPEVIAAVNSWYAPRPYLGLAATSLSLDKVVGTRDGQEIWRPRGPGLVFRPVPDASSPAETPAQRLRQMGTLAQQFSAEFKREASYKEGGPLRLMIRPLYRYEVTKGDVQDGALYALADGTSPQLNLLIESRATKDGYQWQYAMGPNNSVEYHVFHHDREVWHLPQVAPPWPNSKNPLNTYTVFPDLQNEGRSHELAEQLTKALDSLSESSPSR
jgi:hypothetical protein